MTSHNLISADEAFQIISANVNVNAHSRTHSFARAVIDVRSPSEYASGHFLGTKNVPILSDDHRHQVGLTYKLKGTKQAQILGHELVSGDYRKEMIESWCRELSSPQGLVLCWRGGLRSQIAQEWILQSGYEVLRVDGGYKALRALAMAEIVKPRDYILLGGPTGSGKTTLLKQVTNHVDLEELAHHRGSAFGLRLHDKQPTQVNFENNLAQALFLQKSKVLLEDESHLIGHCYLNNELYDQMSHAPMVLLVIDRKLRAQNIYADYITEPQKKGQSIEELSAFYKFCVNQIRKSLGGLLAEECLTIMNSAFANDDEMAHHKWIELLLEYYYDKRYAYGMAKKNRKVIFQGNPEECLEFLQRVSKNEF